jgi:DNA-binding winged helix-turn-helix (wHTH) protein/tetratricopeptide (TPR) repeat protein
MQPADRVDLAHEPGFVLGRLTVRPAVRQLVRDDGEEEVLQHRVMQVLIALARVDGAIVTREQLTMSCWEGRVVGEDAINRILSRLRGVASSIGAGSFRIETITRIGYRLLREGQEAPADMPAEAEPPAKRPSRRHVLIGAGAAGAAVLAGGAWWWGPTREAPPPSPEVAALMQQALQQLAQNTGEGQNQAIGLYRRVVALAPDYADGWGALGCTYAVTAFFRPVAQSDALRARGMAAGRRALALDPDNGYGQVAVATSVPGRGAWLNMDRALHNALGQHPDNLFLLYALTSLMASVGRELEALAKVERLAQLMRPSPPDVYFMHVLVLWSANRLDEADRLIDEAMSLYPTHFAIWFTRVYLLMYSGRAGAALAMIQDRERLPTNIPQAEFEELMRAARAVQSRAAADVESALASQLARAHRGSGYAENAIQFAAAVGRIDDALAILNAYYFGRPFVVPDVRYTVEAGTYSPQRDRNSGFLFLPHMAAVRADPRFDSAMTELGMARYWREIGVQPDYKRP